jgi:hypothetical protein
MLKRFLRCEEEIALFSGFANKQTHIIRRWFLFVGLALSLPIGGCIIQPNIDPRCTERGEMEIGWLFDGTTSCPADVLEMRIQLWRQEEDGTANPLHNDPTGDPYACSLQSVLLNQKFCGRYSVRVSAYSAEGRLRWISPEEGTRIVGGRVNTLRANLRRVP